MLNWALGPWRCSGLEADKLVEEALRADARALAQLAREIGSLMAREERLGDAQVIGRLVKLPRTGRAVVIGDIHGDLVSLQHILRDSQFVERASAGEDLWLIFLGDYGDRGERSPEVYYVVLKLKELFPERVVLLRGNHEGPPDLLASPHDLPYHLIAKFGRDEGLEAYLAIRGLWDSLYTAALAEGLAIMLHGGAPSRARSLDDVAFAHKRHPEEPHLEEILWSDPRDGITGAYPSWRGAGRLFGPDVTRRFLLTVGARVLIRGHEPCETGYSFVHGGLVLTIFSRKGPPYYNESAAYLELDLSTELVDALGLEAGIRVF